MSQPGPATDATTASPSGAPVGGLSELVARAAADRPDRLAVVEAGGRGLTWAALEDEVARFATGLGPVGVVAGRRVAVAAVNRLEFVTSYLGTLRAQAVAVPLNPRATPAEMARALADSGTRLVVADPVALPAVREAVAAVRAARAGEPGDLEPDLVSRSADPQVVVVGAEPGPGERSYASLLADPRPLPTPHDPERLAALLYTSGTSGRPRGAMLTHRALLAGVGQAGRLEPRPVTGDDVVLGLLPLFHVYGLGAVLGGALGNGAKLLLVEHWDPHGVLDVVEDEACSILPLAPPVLVAWREVEGLRERLGPVRLVLSGAAPLEPEVAAEFTERTGLVVHQGYGLTEAAPIVSSTLVAGPGAPPPGSVGRPLPGIEVRLVDDLGNDVEPGDPGEIVVRGANLFSGYWPDGADGPDDDGWWDTGDVALRAPDGSLTLVDRVKELIIVSGFNVYPTEVEDALREAPGVADVAVIGVPDPATGEAVVAYVVPEDGVDDPVGAVEREAARRLARFKHPTRVEVVDQLPLTVTGKVQKGRLRGLERRRAAGLQ